MKRLVTALLLLAAPGLSLADEVNAKVTAVDEREQKVLLDTGKLLVVDPATDVFRDGAAISVEQIQPGDEVRASFDALGQLRSLEVESEGAEPAP